VTFRHVRRRQPVSSWADLLQRPGPGHARQRARVDTLSSHVARAENRARSGKGEQSGAARSRYCAFSHN
jgi:hypothetical protein